MSAFEQSWRIAIVDGVEESALRTQRYFQDRGAVVFCATGPSEVADALHSFLPQAVVMANLPMPAPSVCRRLRSTGFDGVIVVFVGPDVSEVERLAAFAEGADEVVLEPVALPVVEARLRAIFRWVGAPDVVHVNGVVIDFGDCLVRHSTVNVALSRVEVALLRFLVRRRGTVVRRHELLEVSHSGSGGRPKLRTVDSHVLNIRKKLSSGPKSPTIIETVHAVGYRFIGVNQPT